MHKPMSETAVVRERSNAHEIKERVIGQKHVCYPHTHIIYIYIYMNEPLHNNVHPWATAYVTLFNQSIHFLKIIKNIICYFLKH